MKDLTQGNIYKTFFLFGLPLVLSGVLSQTYHIVDTAIAGKLIGESSLAAMGATSPLISAISSIFWGYGVGFSIYIARLFATKHYQKIKSAIYTTFLALVFVCILIAGITIIFRDPLFDILKIAPSLRQEAFSYFSIYIIGIFSILMNNYNLYIVNSFGISSFPFFMSLVSSVVNIVGNLFCILVLKTGVAGLAISTVCASAIVNVLYFLKLKTCFKEMGIQNDKARFNLAHLKDSLPFALPNMAQQTIMYLATLLISPLVNGIGPQASAGYSVVMQIYNLNTSVYGNSSRALSNYSAQCAGKGEFNRIKKGVFVGALQGFLFLLPLLISCVVFYKEICSLFFKSDADILTKEYAYLFTKSYLPFIVFNLLNNLLHGLYKSVKAPFHLFSSTFLGAASQFIVATILIPNMGMKGFFLAWILSWIIEAVYSSLLFFLGFWNPEKKKTKEIVSR